MSGHITDSPLILLPGSLGTSLTWIPNIAALSTHYRTYALDSIYDFGLSVRHRNIKKPDDIVTWLDEVLAALIPEGSVSLIGLSYGGWVASRYTLRFPERVRKAVFLAPALTVLPVSIVLLFRALLTRLPVPKFRKQFYYWLLQDSVRSGELGRASVDEAVADWIVADRCFSSLPAIPATVLDDTALRNFNVPSLFLVGEHEKISRRLSWALLGALVALSLLLPAPLPDEASAFLKTDHQGVLCSSRDIGRVFPEVIWHTEKPVLRTAPAPLILLSRLVRDQGYKVVLTGEGSDEVLGGYDIFKEAKIRRFWAKYPDSKFRPILLRRLYPYMKNLQSQSDSYLRAFFHVRKEDLESPFFSHLPRWDTTSKLKVFFSKEARDTLKGCNAMTVLEAR